MSTGAPYPIGFRVIAEEPFAGPSPATVVECKRVGDTEVWMVTREHDSGPRVTTLWPDRRLRPLGEKCDGRVLGDANRYGGSGA